MAEFLPIHFAYRLLVDSSGDGPYRTLCVVPEGPATMFIDFEEITLCESGGKATD